MATLFRKRCLGNVCVRSERGTNELRTLSLTNVLPLTRLKVGDATTTPQTQKCVPHDGYADNEKPLDTVNDRLHDHGKGRLSTTATNTEP